MRILKYKFISVFLFLNLFHFGCQNLDVQNTQTIDLKNCKNENLVSNCKDTKISTKDSSEARIITKNKIDFMKMHFQNSTDPYFGTSTLPEECLTELDWGHEKQDSEGFWVVSKVLTDDNWNINCNLGSTMSLRVLRYCQKNQQMSDLWVKLKSEIEVKNVRCDGRLEYKHIK